MAQQQPLAFTPATLNQCIDLSATTTCQPWAVAMSPLQIPLIADIYPAFGPSVTSQTTFDASIATFSLLASWADPMQCPGFKVQDPTSAAPVRYAETYSCGVMMQAAVKGQMGTCMSDPQVALLPQLCSETCLQFAALLSNALSDPKLCAQDNLSQDIIVARNILAVSVNQSCATLSAYNQDAATPGQSNCVFTNYRDYVSCGFGGNPAGINAAQAFCKANPQLSCCNPNNLNAPISSVAAKFLARYTPTTVTPPVDNSATIIGGAVGGGILLMLVLMVVIILVAKRKHDNNSIGRGKGQGGFAGNAVVGGGASNTKKGKVIGSRSRLSFIGPKTDGPRKLTEEDYANYPGSGSGSGARRNLPAENLAASPSMSRKLGPTAAQEFSKQTVLRSGSPGGDSLPRGNTYGTRNGGHGNNGSNGRNYRGGY